MHERSFLMQTLPSHITHFRLNTFVYPSLFKNGRQILLKQWSSLWQERFHQLKTEMMFPVQCSAIGVSPRKSAILHRDHGRRMFAVRSVGRHGREHYGKAQIRLLCVDCELETGA